LVEAVLGVLVDELSEDLARLRPVPIEEVLVAAGEPIGTLTSGAKRPIEGQMA
jgi:hypothetical protein